MNRRTLQDCDVIMKGGVTSGIVYRDAILELSKKYRFRSIGGTSVGAIAAAITAAAEYNRAAGGFATIAGIPGEMREHLPTLFQTSPEARTAFALLTIGYLEKRWVRAVGWVLTEYWRYLSVGIAGGGVAAIPAFVLAGKLASLLFLLIGAHRRFRWNCARRDHDGLPHSSVSARPRFWSLSRPNPEWERTIRSQRLARGHDRDCGG
jgi:hypothetical protein